MTATSIFAYLLVAYSLAIFVGALSYAAIVHHKRKK